MGGTIPHPLRPQRMVAHPISREVLRLKASGLLPDRLACFSAARVCLRASYTCQVSIEISTALTTRSAISIVAVLPIDTCATPTDVATTDQRHRFRLDSSGSSVFTFPMQHRDPQHPEARKFLAAGTKQQTVVKDDLSKTLRDTPCPCRSGRKFEECQCQC